MLRGQAVRVPEDETPEPRARDRHGAPIAPAYANYMLGVLVLVYVFNFLDRQIVSILAERIKNDLGVGDGEIGFLYGTAFDRGEAAPYPAVGGRACRSDGTTDILRIAARDVCKHLAVAGVENRNGFAAAASDAAIADEMGAHGLRAICRPV